MRRLSRGCIGKSLDLPKSTMNFLQEKALPYLMKNLGSPASTKCVFNVLVKL